MAGDDGEHHLADSGIKAGSQEGITLIVILVFLCISFYNFLELNLIIFTTFKRRSGLYFWSFMISTWGIAIWSLGFLLKNTGVTEHIPNHYILYMTFVEIGFIAMVTGQSFVLYSRLHIVLHSRKKLRMCLVMIIVDGVICHVPIIVVAFGTNSPNPGPFIVPYSVYEKVMVTIFFVQELILSGIYIRQTLKMMRVERNTGVSKHGSRKLMKHLILVNIIIIALDVTILGLEYAGYYQIQTAYKGLVYSIKLKMEFSILNQLMDMVGGSTTLSSTSRSRGLPTVVRSRIAVEPELGVPMNTFDGNTKVIDGDRRMRRQDLEGGGAAAGGGGGGLGYNAYAHCGDDDKGLRGQDGSGRPVITRTTEVVVHRDDPDDSDSVTADERGNPASPRNRGKVSTSSSEVQFAKA